MNGQAANASNTSNAQAAAPQSQSDAAATTAATSANIGAETGEGTKAEEATPEKKITKREQFLQRFLDSNPDINTSDDDSVFDFLDNDYQRVSDERDNYKKGQEDLASFLSANPKAAMVFSEMMDGKSFPAAVISNYGKEIFSGSDQEIINQIEEADKAYKERIDSVNATQEERMKNLEATLEERNKFMQKYQMSEDEFVKFIDETVNPMIEDYFMGRVGLSLLEAAYKSKEFDSAVREAGEIGKIQGKNEKIVEQKKSFKGDGMPTIEGVMPRAEEVQAKQKANKSFFDGTNL